MIRTNSLLIATALAACGDFGSRVAAGDFDPVVYELREGSALIDDCHCGRLAFQIPMKGTFTLTRLAVGAPIAGELFSITDIAFEGKLGEQPLVVTGGGQYYRQSAEETSLTVDLSINDLSGIHMQGELGPPGAPWPTISATATEDGTRNRPQFYHILLVASPSSLVVRYDLVPGDVAAGTGSFLTDDCSICDRKPIVAPMQGFFSLLPVDVGGPNPFNRYDIDSIHLTGDGQDFSYTVTGGGSYQWGGEVALSQLALLHVTVNGEGVALASDAAAFPQGVAFPTIDIELHHLDPASLLHIYTLHLVAKPTAEPPQLDFRRGDSNGDGTLDISDAVFTLLWLFGGGPTPTCLDAADSNGDLNHDLSDPVFALDFLFRGGAAPPAPGPAECGQARETLGCESYAACPG